MALIDSFSEIGDYDVEEILISEGFKINDSNELYKVLEGFKKEVIIRYVNQIIYCELRDENGFLFKKKLFAVQKKDSFFERYALVMYTVRDFLNNETNSKTTEV